MALQHRRPIAEHTDGSRARVFGLKKREIKERLAKMKIEKISIDEIKPYENNAKLHPPEQIEQIKKSISEFGNNDPIAVDENNVIIEGHGRYEALKQLGFDKIAVIRLSHLTEQQKKAYILAHNKLTMNTGFDFDVLNLELEDIVDFDMSDFGFIIDLPENSQTILEGRELNTEDFNDEKFRHECPRCGFRWNDE